MNYIVYFLTLIDQTILGVFFYSQFLRLKTHFIIPCSVWFTTYSVSFMLFHLLGEKAPPSYVQMLICMLYQTAVLIFFEGSRFKRFCIACLFIILSGAAELLTLGILCFTFDMSPTEFYVFQDENVIIAIGRVYAIDTLFLFTFATCLIFAFRHIKEEFLIRDVLLIIGFDLIHMIYLFIFYTDPANRFSEANNIIQFGMQTLLIAMMFHQFYKGREVRQLEKAKKKLEVIRKEREREIDYYKAAEEKYTEISMIRHDLVNHLTAVEALAGQPECRADARKLLNEIKRRTYAIKVPGNENEKKAGEAYAENTDI
ncbi:MAG: hypothetical protein K6G82_08480 [Ruminococcus sp.]|nr:hypothetical protein [Ruminococcus sp.]